MTRITEKSRHLIGLDGLRGLAAIAVLLHHLDLSFEPRGIWRHSYLAVDLFFVLSGFVIALSYEPRLRGGMPLSAYFRARFIRLYPMIALGLMLGLAQQLARLGPTPSLFAAAALQAAFVPLLWRHGAIYPLNTPQWSLLFEGFVNVVHATTLRYLTNLALIAVIVVSAVALTVAGHHYKCLWIGFDQNSFLGGFPKVMFTFFAGVGLCRLYEHRPPKLRLSWVVSAAALVATFVGARLVPESWHASRIDTVIVLLIWPAIVWACASADPVGLTAKACKWLGNISYPLYAIQEPIRYAIEGIVRASPATPLRLSLAWWIGAAVTLMLSHLVAVSIEPKMRAALSKQFGKRPPKEVLQAAP